MQRNRRLDEVYIRLEDRSVHAVAVVADAAQLLTRVSQVDDCRTNVATCTRGVAIPMRRLATRRFDCSALDRLGALRSAFGRGHIGPLIAAFGSW